MKLTLRKSAWMDDWYVIERAEHDGREWEEKVGPNTYKFCKSARFSGADVEGSAKEMREIARAIRKRKIVGFKRCWVNAEGDPVLFMSPRNSRTTGECSYVEALELAEEIEALLKAEPSK